MFGFDGKYGDFCRSYHDRTQPFYYTLDHFPKCPIEAGVNLTFFLKTNFFEKFKN